MSANTIGGATVKAALAGFALATLTAVAVPANATVVTWDLWLAYNPDRVAAGKTNMLTGQWVDPNPFGITMDTKASGFVTFDDAGCGKFFCGPVEDSDFEIFFEFEGTSLAFTTGDDFRYNEATNTYPDPVNPGPTMGFFGPFIWGPDFNAPFEHGNVTSDNWALNLQTGAVELYDLTNLSGHPNWTVLRGTLCHNGYGEPGADSACYRQPEQVVTPIPAALPLFGSGLAAMGLAAWRRRRKA